MSKTKQQQRSESEIVEELRSKFGIKRYRESTDAHAREYLTRVLTATGGDRMTAARISGLNRTHLQALIKRHRVEVAPNLTLRGRRKRKSDEADETEAADDEVSA